MPSTQPTNLASGFILSASFEEFSRKAHLVPIIKSRNSDGQMIWECRDNDAQRDSFGALRQFIFHCHRHHIATTGEVMSDVQTKQWVDGSVNGLLDPSTVCVDGLYYAIGPDNHVLILYRSDNGPLVTASRNAILGLVWHIELDQSKNAS